MIVLLLFFLSGATALVYEVIWSKHLALMFGSTVQAQTVVLAVFMGGLALGNRLFGKRSAQLKQPLAAYGYVELAIGLYAFFFHSIYGVADRVFIAVGSKFAESPTPLLLLKGLLAVGLLILPTVMMGGTLPLLAAWLQRRMTDAGRGSARFYSTNSLGAVFGAGMAGFYLVQQWGMLASLQWAAFANLFIAIAAIAISRQHGDLDPIVEKPVTTEPVFPARAALLFVMVTGGVSMGLEVLCSRAVALLVGGSIQSFAIVLMAFILGIGSGAGLVASPRFAKWQNQRTIFGLMLAAAAVIGIFIFGAEDWAILYSRGRLSLAPNPGGYFLHQFFVALMSILTLGIPAGLLGAVLPMAIRAGSPNGGSLGDQVGKLLTWNTLGAVIGVLLTGFVLMPLAGLRESFLILGSALAIIAAVGARRCNSPRLSLAGYGVVASLMLMLVAGSESWRHIFGAGLYRFRTAALSHESVQRRQKEVLLRYYKDAPDATVVVEQTNDKDEPLSLSLRINGKADASTHGDLATQYLVGHLPLIARPESKDVFVLGFGSGISAAAVLAHPIDSLTLAENCAPVIEASQHFEKWNRSALKDPRLHLRREDARTVLKLSDKKYDIITSEPSNPWVVGVGSVFSKEFYQLCASRLKEGGINAQWFHIYEMHDGIVELVIRTFSSVYPYVEVWEPQSGDLVLLGSMKKWDSSIENFKKAFAREQPRRDLEEIGVKTPAALLAKQLASQQTAFAMVGDGPVQTDEFPILEYTAPEAFFIGQRAQRLFSFDERTRQMAMADDSKRDLLRNLPDDLLHSAYSEFATSNPELLKYLQWRAKLGATTNQPIYDLDPAMPIIFRPANTYALTAGPGASEVEVTLFKAETDLLRGNNSAQAIAAIENALQTELKEPAKNKRKWAPVHFAIVAARALLAENEIEHANKLIELGMKFDAENAELPYLRRLLEARRGPAAVAAPDRSSVPLISQVGETTARRR